MRIKEFDYLCISYSKNQSKNIVQNNSLAIFTKSRLSKYTLALGFKYLFKTLQNSLSEYIVMD